MRIELFLDGKIYKSKKTNEATAEETAEKLFEIIAEMNRFKMELEDGSFLVFGKDAVQRAHFLFF